MHVLLKLMIKLKELLSVVATISWRDLQHRICDAKIPDIWDASVGERNLGDHYAVAIMKEAIVVGHIF